MIESKWVNAAGEPKFGKIIGTVLLSLIGLILIWGSFGTIPTGSIGIRTLGNAVIGTVTPGYYLKIPIIQQVITMDVQTQKESVESVEAASADLQTVKTNVAVNYHVGAKEAVQIFTNVGADYVSRVMDPAIQEAVKATTASSTAEQLITHREAVRDSVIALLTSKMAGYGITVETINITNFDFSPSFNAAIEAKVTTEQNALAAKNKLDQVQYEADQRIAQARGEAEAIKIQSQAIESGGGKNYVALQAISKWDGHLPQYMIPGAATPILDLRGLNATP
jgi:regulator of protease activity HflC (stomatin/prohibitin superfamily)